MVQGRLGQADHQPVGGSADDGTGVAIPAAVSLAEISGSETYVHADTPVGPLVAQLPGVHRFGLGEALALRVDARDLYVFDAAGRLAAAPAQPG